MVSNEDQLPRVFQANLGRLFDRVILPAMNSLPYHEVLEIGQAATLDQFLDRTRAQVDNYTGNEAAKAFCLTLAGIFERQLSIWVRTLQNAEAPLVSGLQGFERLLAGCARHAGIDLAAEPMGADLTELFVVANVVRHGEGRSCDRLRAIAPSLWNDAAQDYFDLLPGDRVGSEHVRIGMPELVRYIRAVTRFWGLADPLPMALTNPPYGAV